MEMEMSNYEAFVSASPYASFMQSEDWIKVKEGWGCERITVTDDSGKVTGAMQILIKKIPMMRTAFLYAPRGPVCDPHDEETLRKLVEKAREVAKKYHAYMLKVDPLVEADDVQAIETLKKVGFTHRTDIDEDNTVQSVKNYILEINGRTPDEVFQSFHSKWRYKIRLASKKGVVCAPMPERLDDFCKLMEETGERDHFHIRSKEYFARMLEAFGENARLYMCVAPDGEAISGALTVRFADRVSYVYGASGNGHRNLMPNYLMQWTMIQWALESGCNVYDFMGVPHYDDENHPNYGVYKFKKGFSGRAVAFAGEFDIIFSSLKFKEIALAYKVLKKRKM